MSNMLLGHSNRIDGALLNDGAWQTTLPLTNLQNRTLGLVARSNDAQLSSTQFKIDLQQSASIRVLGLDNHNMSPDAAYRITASLTSDFAALVYDSGWLDVWPIVYPFGSVEWDSDSFWSGQYSAEELDGTKWLRPHILPAPTYARFWRIEIDDTTNTDGFVQIGRPFIGPAWQPSHNMSVGASIAIETDTEVQKARSGAEYFDRRRPRRVASFTIGMLEQDESYGIAFEILRRAGIDGEVLFIFDPDDTVHAIRRQFLARLRQQSAIEHPYPLYESVAFQAAELL